MAIESSVVFLPVTYIEQTTQFYRDVIGLFARHYPKDYPEPESAVCVLHRKKKIVEIPVIMRERTGGVSSISPGNSIYYMIKVSLAILIEWIRH